MNNTFTRYCLAFNKKKKKTLVGTLYILSMRTIFVYITMLFCVCITVSDILKIIIWNHNTCIKLAPNFD